MARAGEESERFICIYCTFNRNSTSWLLVICNVFLVITSVLSNTVILAALFKESSLHPPSKILLRSLTLTDLCVGILVEPLFLAFLLTKEYENWNLCSQIAYIISSINMLFCLLSLFTLTAIISVDRLLALLLGMRYRQQVTFKRVLGVVIFFWILGVCLFVTTFSYFSIISYYSFLAVLICLVISTCCYAKIYRKLLHHQAQIQEHVQQVQPNGHEPLNIAQYRKTVCSALWVQVTLLACYLPACVVSGLLMFGWDMTPTLMLTWMLSLTLVYLNSTLNPILYCWRMKEVRRAAIDTITQISCCLTS